MTIDEAIKMYKKIANTDANCPRYCMRPCEDCVQEHKQLAEWLEELKSYRAKVFSGDMTQSMIKEERNKAIYDFAEKFIFKAVCEGCSGCCNCYEESRQNECEDYKAYMEIAEQFKAGGGVDGTENQ